MHELDLGRRVCGVSAGRLSLVVWSFPSRRLYGGGAAVLDVHIQHQGRTVYRGRVRPRDAATPRPTRKSGTP